MMNTLKILCIAMLTSSSVESAQIWTGKYGTATYTTDNSGKIITNDGKLYNKNHAMLFCSGGNNYGATITKNTNGSCIASKGESTITMNPSGTYNASVNLKDKTSPFKLKK